jgi:hypothetical protein
MRDIMTCLDEINRFLFVPEDSTLKVLSADSLMSSINKAYEILQSKFKSVNEKEMLFFSDEAYVKQEKIRHEEILR